MEDRETARMRKYEESKTTQIMMATIPHVTSGLELRKFQADGFLLTRVYISTVLSRQTFFVNYCHMVCVFAIRILTCYIRRGWGKEFQIFSLCNSTYRYSRTSCKQKTSLLLQHTKLVFVFVWLCTSMF